MNKKLIALTTSLAIGGTLLGTTVFASSNSTSGYDTYKSALLNMHNVKSMTDKVNASITDNGNSLISAALSMKVNKDSKSMSGTADIKAGNSEMNSEIYNEDGKTITKNSSSDVYNEIEIGNNKVNPSINKPDEAQIQQRVQNMQNIVDALIGNGKNYFVVSDNNDGTKSVNIKLTQDQVPAAANAIASAIIRNREDALEKDGNTQDKLKVNFPVLVKDISVTDVDVTAVINSDNMIAEQKGEVTLTGKDAAGTVHTIVLNLDVNILNVNSTTPDTVNLTGKQVKTITKASFKHNR